MGALEFTLRQTASASGTGCIDIGPNRNFCWYCARPIAAWSVVAACSGSCWGLYGFSTRYFWDSIRQDRMIFHPVLWSHVAWLLQAHWRSSSINLFAVVFFLICINMLTSVRFLSLATYRPISLLPIAAKILEKVVHKQVTDFFKHNPDHPAIPRDSSVVWSLRIWARLSTVSSTLYLRKN